MAVIPDTWIIQFAPDAGTSGDLAYELRERGAIIRFVYPHAILGFSAVIANPALLDELRADPRVTNVEADQEHPIEFLDLGPPITEQALVAMGPGWSLTEGTPPPPPGTDAGGVVASFGHPWQLDRICKSKPVLDQTYRYRYTGAGVRIYYLDTGCNEHPDFGARRVDLWCDPAWNPPGDTALIDLQHHGTVGAGCCAGATVGVAKDATICVARLGLGGIAEMIDMLETVLADYLAAGDPAVCNMSYSGMLTSEALEDAYEACWDAGIVMVAAGGNSKEDSGGGLLPQRIKDESGKLIVVGAAGSALGYGPGTSAHWANDQPFTPSIQNNVGVRDGIDPYSAQGSWVDVFAPSHCVTVSPNYHSGPQPNHPVNDPYTPAITTPEWDRTSLGTSFSAPMTVGVIACLLEEFPTATPEEIRTLLIDRSLPTIVGMEDTLGAIPAGTANRMLTSCQNLWDETTEVVTPVIADSTYHDATVVYGEHYRWRVRRTTGNLINGEWSETDWW